MTMKHIVRGLADAAKTHNDIAEHHAALADYHNSRKEAPLAREEHIAHRNLEEAHRSKADERHERAKHVAKAARDAGKTVDIALGDAPKKGEKITIKGNDPYTRHDAEYIARMGVLHTKLAAINAQISAAARSELGKRHDRTLTPLLRSAADHHHEAAKSDAEGARTYLREARELRKLGA